MNTPLIEKFGTLVTRFEQHRGFMDKARALADSYSPLVVERVGSDHEQRSNELLTELIPLMIEVEEAADGLDDDRESSLAGVTDVRAAAEELELRRLIGDIDEEEAELEAALHSETLAGVDAHVAELDGEIAAFRAQLDAWRSIGLAAGVLNPEES